MPRHFLFVTIWRRHLCDTLLSNPRSTTMWTACSCVCLYCVCYYSNFNNQSNLTTNTDNDDDDANDNKNHIKSNRVTVTYIQSHGHIYTRSLACAAEGQASTAAKIPPTSNYPRCWRPCRDSRNTSHMRSCLPCAPHACKAKTSKRTGKDVPGILSFCI